eukprot:7504608-Ditylum_brightwellii.AAC.1
MECDYYLLPYISKCNAGFSFYQKLPGGICNNAWILSIDDVEPHSVENAISLLQGKQHGKTSNIVNYLAKCGSAPHCNRIEENCQIFKQVSFKPTALLMPKSATFICFNDTIMPIARKVVFSPHYPQAPEHMGDFSKDPFHAEWKDSIFKNYDKINTSCTFSVPCSHTDIPPGAKVLRT